MLTSISSVASKSDSSVPFGFPANIKLHNYLYYIYIYIFNAFNLQKTYVLAFSIVSMTDTLLICDKVLVLLYIFSCRFLLYLNKIFFVIYLIWSTRYLIISSPETWFMKLNVQMLISKPFWKIKSKFDYKN